MKRKIIMVLVTLFLMGIIFGLVNTTMISNELMTNSFYFYLNLLVYLIVYGLAVIGLPSFIFILLFEAFSSGFVTTTLLYNYSLNCFIFLLLFFIYKACLIFLLLLNSFYYCKYVKHLTSIVLKKGLAAKRNTYLYLKKMTIMMVFIIFLIIIYHFFII